MTTSTTAARQLRAFIVFSPRPIDLPTGVDMRRDNVIIVDPGQFIELTKNLPKSGEAALLAHLDAAFAVAQTPSLRIHQIDGIVMSKKLQGSDQAFNTFACYGASRDRLLRPTDEVHPL